MYHIIIEQTQEYENRMKYDPTRNIFFDTDYKSLMTIRNFLHPYGWIKESGTPPGPHLDAILLSSEKYKLGDEIEVKIVGCFMRNDGDNKLIGILPERTETDFHELPENEKEDLSRLYPRIDEGEGWFCAKKANEIIERFFNLNKLAEFRLVTPSKEYEERAFEYIQEFKEYNSEINGTGGLNRYDNYDEWLLKLKKDLDFSNIPEDKVPANTYFFARESEDKIIGMINIRHKLNDFLFNEGGHIGYSIRPTERRKGYASLMLKLGLQKCVELNLDRVLITCDKKNIASAKVIQNNNGILENEIYSETFSEIVQRYWINL